MSATVNIFVPGCMNRCSLTKAVMLLGKRQLQPGIDGKPVNAPKSDVEVGDLFSMLHGVDKGKQATCLGCELQ